MKIDGWTLINRTTKEPLQEGELYKTFRGVHVMLAGGRVPNKKDKQGFVWVKTVYGSEEISASAINAEWIRKGTK